MTPMKFAISKFEQFAVTSHLVGQPSPNPEHGRKRLRAWDELGVADLADKLATLAAGFGGEIKSADWADRTASIVVDINADVLDYVITGLGVQTSGIWTDVLGRLRERLEQLRDKKYELPQELRTP